MTDAQTTPTSPAPAAVADTTPAVRHYSTRQVLSGFWRLMVGIKDGLALVFLLMFFAVIAAALAGRPNPAAVFETGALVLRLDGTVVEQPAQVSAINLLSGEAPMREFRRDELVRALNAAATDARVKTVVLDLDQFMGGGQVALGDVAEAIDRVRAARKPVLAYATAYTDDAYQLAAHASEIWTDSSGGVFLAGPGGGRLYYRGLIDRLGINAHIYRVGTFKSAVEPYLRTDQSPEAREATLAYATVLWDQWRQQVRRARPAAQLDAYIADPAAAVQAAGNDMAKAAQTAKLVDRIGTRLDFDRRVAAIAGSADDERPWKYNRIHLDAWIEAHPVEETGSPIAVVPVVGAIIDGESVDGNAGGETIARHILDAVADDDVKALVLRVDSPGGSVLASDRIRSALLQAKARNMPIVVSMGNVAASGGYWISTPGDRIFAEPDTITGSIGVFAMLPSFENAIGRIGLTADGITTTPMSGQPDLLRGTNAQFDALAQSSVEQIYARFTGLVAASRKLPIGRVREIAEGRVWAGGTARQLGLVDRFGGLDDAIAEAARLARLDPEQVYPRYFEQQPDDFAKFVQSLSKPADDRESGPSGFFAHAAWQRQAWMAQMLTDVRRMASVQGVEASCLECRSLQPPRAPSQQDVALIARLMGI